MGTRFLALAKVGSWLDNECYPQVFEDWLVLITQSQQLHALTCN